MTDDGCSGTCEDLDNDELTQVFGKEKRVGVRAVGSNISKRQLLHIGVGMSKADGKKKANEEAAVSLEEKIISHIDSKFHNFEATIMSLVSKLASVSSSPLVNTPSSDIGSYSVYRPTNLAQNLNNIFATTGIPHCRHPNLT